jgi:molybdopterin-guanine dinucleotide biosynthesis protein A
MRLGPETPKALRSFGGIPLYERAIRFCRGLTDDVWVSVPTGLELPGPGARVVRDPRAFGPWPGPLVALGWALQGIERPWALVLAVDLPLVRRTLVDFLWAKRGEPSTPAPEAPGGPEALAVVPWRHGPEPLLAFYRREAGPPLLALASGGERAVVRAVAALPLVRVAEEDWRRADPEARSFENANTPGDWARLEQLLLSEEPGA